MPPLRTVAPGRPPRCPHPESRLSVRSPRRRSPAPRWRRRLRSRRGCPRRPSARVRAPSCARASGGALRAGPRRAWRAGRRPPRRR
eukprot:scaffold680_cov309-Prasinococcus_capsulatus_cf.AAC.3